MDKNLDFILEFFDNMGYTENQSGTIVITNMQAVLYYLKEIGYKPHHSATRAGYISRKIVGTIEKYSGRIGKGFIISVPAMQGSRYFPICYYIYEDIPAKADIK